MEWDALWPVRGNVLYRVLSSNPPPLSSHAFWLTATWKQAEWRNARWSSLTGNTQVIVRVVAFTALGFLVRNIQLWCSDGVPFPLCTRSIVPSHNVAGPCCSFHTVCQVYSVSSPLCTRSIVFPSHCVLGLQYSLSAVYLVHVVPFTLFTRSIVFPPHCVLGL